MKSKAELHNLIKGMSKSEKRFFKLSSSIHRGNKNYLLLFDAIEKQIEYDEKKIKYDLRHSSIVKNFAYEKNYLFNVVLKTLRHYHAGKGVDSELYEILENISLLYKRGLYTPCEKLLDKAQKIAEQNEQNAALMDILKWKWELMHATYSFNRINNELPEVMRTYEKACEQILNLNKYKELASRIFVNTYMGVHIRGVEQESVFKKLSSSPVLADEKKALTPEAKLYFWLIKSNLFFVRRDWENAYKSSVNLLHLLETKPDKIQEEPRKYIIVLNNIITCCTALNKKRELFYYLDKIEKFPETISDIRKEALQEDVFLYANHARLQYFWRNSLFNEGVHHATTIQKRLLAIIQHPRHVNHELLFKYMFSILFFGIKKYKKSIYWLNQVINHPSKGMREDVISSAMIFNIILHYEYGNNDITDYLVRSAYRYLYKKNRLYKFENIILTFIRKKLPNANNKKKLVDAFGSLKKELMPLLYDGYESKAFEHFNLIIWLNSKIENISFAEATKKFNSEIS